MCLEEMKTIGAVEMTVGLMDLSLGLILHQVPLPFKKQMFIVYIAAVSTICMGMFLVCGGRKPARACVRCNTVMHLCVVLFNVTAFGLLVRHVPFKQKELIGPDGYSVWISSYGTGLIGGLLILLLVSLMLESILSLCLVLIGWAVMAKNTSQTQAPECSATSEPLCVDPTSDAIPTSDPDPILALEMRSARFTTSH